VVHLVAATNQHRRGDAGNPQATAEDCQPLSPRVFSSVVSRSSFISQLRVCAKRPAAFRSQDDDRVHERALVLVVPTKKRPLGAELYPGRIEDLTGAGSQLDEEGAVSVSIIQ
jgi:hypothetical protein